MNILIVEDEPKVVDFLRKGLEEQGYDVDVAFDRQMGERLALKNATITGRCVLVQIPAF